MIQPVGYFSIFRELFIKPIWLKSSNEQRVILITLIAMANFKPKQWEWKGKKYEVQKGQFITSAKSIIENCNGSVTRQNIRSALARFEKLDFLTMESTKTGMLITIHNWELYQVDKVKGNQATNQEVTKSQPTGNQEVTTREEGNKDKEGKKEQKNICLYDYWQEKAPHKHKFISELICNELNKVKAKEVEEIKIAIDRYVKAYNDDKYFYNQTWVLNNFLKQSNGYKQWLDDGQNWVMYQEKQPDELDKSKGHIIGANCNTKKITRRPPVFEDVI